MCAFKIQRNIAEIAHWGRGVAVQMEVEKTQSKVLSCPKKIYKIFLGHGVPQNTLNGQPCETQRQTVEFCPTELPLWIISLSLFPRQVSLSPSLFLNLYYYLFLGLCLFLFFFLPLVSYNLTPMLQFVSLSFIYILGPLLLSSLCMWPPPPVLRH